MKIAITCLFSYVSSYDLGEERCWLNDHNRKLILDANNDYSSLECRLSINSTFK